MSFEEEASYFFPHGLDYGGRGQSLQDLLGSADFDFAGAPQVARNAQDGRREVFVVGADDGTIYHTWEWPPNSDNWSQWKSMGGANAVVPQIRLTRNRFGGIRVIIRGGSNRGLLRNDQVPDRRTGQLNKWTGWHVFSPYMY
jgi:hypothetical protein